MKQKRQKTADTAASAVVRVPEGQICDHIDGVFRKDTPEEFIRQTIEKRLVSELRYPRERIAVEFALKAGASRLRADLAVFADERRAQENVILLVECKSARIAPGDRNEGVAQLKSYMSVCANCEWGMWTNGEHKEVWRKIRQNGKITLRECIDIPAVDGDAEQIDRPTHAGLRNAAEDNLLLVFRACHNHIYATDGLPKARAFFELLKLIFCKTLDEHIVDSPLDFYATSAEIANADGRLTVKKRIAAIFNKVKREYPLIFDGSDELELQPESLARIVAELQHYSLLNTHVDVKGKAYEELVGANLRGDRGEFFTPRNAAKMAVEMIAPRPDERVCDPACGTGGFLVMAMKYVIDRIEAEAEKNFGQRKADWDAGRRETVKARIRSIAAKNFFGFDINPDLVKATKMNMVMNNDGSGNIYRNDSLLPPHRWNPEMKANFTVALGVDEDAVCGEKTIGFFDVVVTNPPFGSKIPIQNRDTLSQFNLGHIWTKLRDNSPYQVGEDAVWELTGKLQKSAPPEQLFIERCLQLLKPGGRLAIVLPDSILGNPGLAYIRRWLLAKTRVVASIDMHSDLFQPRNGTQTSVLVLQKKTDEELREQERTGLIPPRNVFMAIVEKVGHDKRGNPVFRRDLDGGEIWMDDPSSDTPRKVRVLDDDTAFVPLAFAEFKKHEKLGW